MLVETAGRVRIGREGHTGSQDRISRDTILGCPEGTGTSHVIDVPDHVRYLLMTAAKAVGHLHLGQVEVLRATVRLQGHAVQQETCCRGVNRREPEGEVRTCCAVFASIGVRLSLPFHEFVGHPLVVSAEIAADGLYD